MNKKLLTFFIRDTDMMNSTKKIIDLFQDKLFSESNTWKYMEVILEVDNKNPNIKDIKKNVKFVNLQKYPNFIKLTSKKNSLENKISSSEGIYINFINSEKMININSVIFLIQSIAGLDKKIDAIIFKNNYSKNIQFMDPYKIKDTSKIVKIKNLFNESAFIRASLLIKNLKAKDLSDYSLISFLRVSSLMESKSFYYINEDLFIENKNTYQMNSDYDFDNHSLYILYIFKAYNKNFSKSKAFNSYFIKFLSKEIKLALLFISKNVNKKNKINLMNEFLTSLSKTNPTLYKSVKMNMFLWFSKFLNVKIMKLFVY